MPVKLKTKLKEKEFYCVKCRQRCKSNPDSICVVKFKNGAHALNGACDNCDCSMYKFIKESDVNKFHKKYENC